MNNKNELIKGFDFPLDIAAGYINRKGIGMTELENLLIALSYIKENKDPYLKYVQKGYFISHEFKMKIDGGHKQIYETSVTIKGLNLLRKLVDKYVE